MTPQDVLLAYPTWIIDVEVLHELRLQVKYEPDEGDRHFSVYGWEALPKKKTIRVRRKASFRARIIRMPAIE